VEGISSIKPECIKEKAINILKDRICLNCYYNCYYGFASKEFIWIEYPDGEIRAVALCNLTKGKRVYKDIFDSCNKFLGQEKGS
jgi:hypothetical protein